MSSEPLLFLSYLLPGHNRMTAGLDECDGLRLPTVLSGTGVDVTVALSNEGVILRFSLVSGGIGVDVVVPGFDKVVEQSNVTSFKLCRDVQRRCILIEKNGTFDDFRKCLFQCDGWVKPENTKEYTAYLCPASGGCQQLSYFTQKIEQSTFYRLKDCFETCMPVPSAPLNVTAEAINSTAIQIRWRPPRNIDRKLVYYSVLITYYGHNGDYQYKYFKMEPSSKRLCRQRPATCE
ncbi:hypothetical protein SprV_0602137700 [Sparganum proliferum]